MKERLEIAEKSLLLSIPYLILLSLAYYRGYWGYFDVDAINYYGVQDLIKGCAYALPVIAITALIFIITNKVLDYITEILREKLGKVIARLVAGLPFVIIYLLYVFGILPDVINWIGPLVLSMIALTILEGISNGIRDTWEWATNNDVPFFFAKWFTIFGIISFFISYSYGKNKAIDIVKNKYFSYSKIKTPPDSTGTNSALKYLGKAGDYYLFIAPDNKAKHIISIQKIPNLVLYNYDETDTASTHAYHSLIGEVPNRK